MKLRVITVGKPENQYYKALSEMYFKRIQHYMPVEMDYIRQEKIAALPDLQILNKEADRLLKKLNTKDFNIVLEKSGETFFSEEFARFLEQKVNQGTKRITFIIGGPLGLSSKVIQVANKKISFSRMTFAHELALIILLEQIYRAQTILHREKYHK